MWGLNCQSETTDVVESKMLGAWMEKVQDPHTKEEGEHRILRPHKLLLLLKDNSPSQFIESFW